MVLAHNIRKSFGSQQVLNGVSLEIKPGEIHGLAGVNGAGKTTLIHILSDLLSPDEGHVEINGIVLSNDEVSWRRFTKFAFDQPELIEDYLVIEQVRFSGFLQNVSDRESKRRGTILCEIFEVPIDKRISDLSMGQKVKLSLIVNLLAPLSYWILDEPFVHLDLASRRNLTQVLELLKTNGVGILITTHEVDILRTLPDYIHVLKNGKILSVDSETVSKTPVDDGLSELLNEAEPDAIIVREKLDWLLG